MSRTAAIEAFFDEPTNTISYLLADPIRREAAVIDPVLDFDLAGGEVDTRSAERISIAPWNRAGVLSWFSRRTRMPTIYPQRLTSRRRPAR